MTGLDHSYSTGSGSDRVAGVPPRNLPLTVPRAVATGSTLSERSLGGFNQLCIKKDNATRIIKSASPRIMSPIAVFFLPYLICHIPPAELVSPMAITRTNIARIDAACFGVPLNPTPLAAYSTPVLAPSGASACAITLAKNAVSRVIKRVRNAPITKATQPSLRTVTEFLFRGNGGVAAQARRYFAREGKPSRTAGSRAAKPTQGTLFHRRPIVCRALLTYARSKP